MKLINYVVGYLKYKDEINVQQDIEVYFIILIYETYCLQKIVKIPHRTTIVLHE